MSQNHPEGSGDRYPMEAAVSRHSHAFQQPVRATFRRLDESLGELRDRIRELRNDRKDD